MTGTATTPADTSWRQQRPTGFNSPKSSKTRRALHWLSLGCAVGMGLLALVKAKPALSAEAVVVTYGPIEVSLRVQDLETFAETGEVRGGMRLVSRFVDPQTLAELRQFLRYRFEVNPFTVSQLTYSTLGVEALQRLGTLLRTDAGLNGFYALRSAMILAATDPEGLSILNFLRRYPSPNLRLSAPQLLQLQQEFLTQIAYRDAAIEAIIQESEREIAAAPPVDFSQLPNLRQSGPYGVEAHTLELNRARRTLLGESIDRPFRVLVYLPVGLPQPAPVVVISHGLGSSPEAFAYLGEALASHGFAAVLPQHIGSDESRREAVLTGGVLGSIATPVEFVDRPFDISYTLDTLEQLAQTDPTFAGRLNAQQVGVIGHSFGGYTALALAGADLDTTHYLRQQCSSLQGRLDLSFVLQCSAQDLPPYSYPLRDSRVKAAVAISPLTSLVFGPWGMNTITVPTMMVSGSNDFVASAVPEQIHPFLWLTTPDKYLAVMVPSSHTFADATPVATEGTLDALGGLLSGPDPALGRQYVQELSLAFMQTYLNQQPEYQAFLSAQYAQSISQTPLDLFLVRSLTPEQLEQAFGRTPPLPFFPDVATVQSSERAGAVLQDIAETGVLRAAVRTDVPLFGEVTATGQPRGYCVELLTAFAEQLQQQLNRPVQLEIAAESTRVNRFDLVRNGTVAVECGPNTLRPEIEDREEVAFSTPFFLTGTQFLVRTNRPEPLNPLGGLENVRIGVIDGTATAAFVQQRYPNARIVEFPAATQQATVIQALSNDELDAVAGDGILLFGASAQQNLSPADYTLIPTSPLTCDVYGLLLPNDDPQWRNTVNSFITSPTARAVRRQQFPPTLTDTLFLALDSCVQ